MSRADRTSRIEQEIEQNLKRAFDDVADQEVPSRLTDLLAQLRSKETDRSQQDAKDEGDANDS